MWRVLGLVSRQESSRFSDETAAEATLKFLSFFAYIDSLYVASSLVRIIEKNKASFQLVDLGDILILWNRKKCAPVTE